MTTGLLDVGQVVGAVDNIQPSDMNSLEERIQGMDYITLFQAWKKVSGLNNFEYPEASIVRGRLAEELNRRSDEAEQQSRATEFGDF